MVVFTVLVNELKAKRNDSNIGASVSDKHLFTILAKYFGWPMSFFTVRALIVHKVSCNIFDVTRCSYIMR